MNSRPSSVSSQIIEWVERNRRAIDNIEVGTVALFIHQFTVRRVRIGQDVQAQDDAVVIPLEIPTGH